MPSRHLPLLLGLEIDGEGAHPAAWRRAGHPPAELLDPRRLREVAEVAERAGFAFVTLDDDIVPPGSGPDRQGRIGSIERAAYLAPALSTLAVVPVVSTTYSEPFHLSSQLATVDHVAEGRSGWIVSTSPTAEAARAWGRPRVEDFAREASDAVRVVRDLWDSWEDDAVIRDVTTSRYLDRERVHYIDFVGETYSVKGPAIVPRPPQGQLVVLAPEGLVPDESVDVVLVGGPDIATVKARAGAHPSVQTVVELEVALDTDDLGAEERVAALEQHGPWPDRGRLRYTGAPAGLVELLADLAGSVAGVRIHPLVLDEDLAVLSRLVAPRLIAAGASARPRPATTFRAAFGLVWEPSRFASIDGAR